jgi:hypothetical protein
MHRKESLDGVMPATAPWASVAATPGVDGRCLGCDPAVDQVCASPLCWLGLVGSAQTSFGT